MKKIISLILSFTLTFFFLACEEDFNPKAALTDGYVLNCIIELENTPTGLVSTIEAKLRRVYDVDGFNPKPPDSVNTASGAQLSFYKGSLVYPMTHMVVVKKEPKQIIFDKYIPSKYPTFVGNEKCRIVASLPNGKILSAEALIPREKSFEFSRTFNHGITGKVNPFYWGKTLTISWGDPYNSGHCMFPKFVIAYRIDSVYFQKEIPLTYIKRNGKFEALMPGPVYVPEITYDYASIDSAMSSIGAGLPDKRKITIINCVFTLIEYDKNLSSFYASTNGFMDSYSIRLDENIYSNVNGGYGLFGVIMKTRFTLPVDRDYISSFGYSKESDGL